MIGGVAVFSLEEVSRLFRLAGVVVPEFGEGAGLLALLDFASIVQSALPLATGATLSAISGWPFSSSDEKVKSMHSLFAIFVSAPKSFAVAASGCGDGFASEARSPIDTFVG